MRIVIYAHLAAVAFCLCFSLADRGLFVSHAASVVVLRLVPFIFPLALLAWLACPIAALVIYHRSQTPKKLRWAVVAEVALWCAQWVVLLPTVQ
jgi:hypothetical protein